MRCPKDDTTLATTKRSGIDIEYCPQCRGVWLDRGELDKLIIRAGQPGPLYTASPRREGGDGDEPTEDRRRRLLGELFGDL
ncbi:MAG: zf-TFIIB domain-containing protein [Acidimicrobiia bacterium]